ncbi:MAG: UvrD-helicase domain-containing protein, partial [Actinomycetota bacterium]
MSVANADQLNPNQHEAVFHSGGPLLVIAGAGSGKTRVLTQRIAHLVRTGVHPMHILAITFTNKAADEMRHRVADLVGDVASKMWVSTFHKACVRMLRMNADRIGYNKAFTIYDSQDSKRLVGYVIRDMGLDPRKFPAGAAQARISLWKNELIDANKAHDIASNIVDKKHAEVFAEYQNRLLRAGAMDFDDLLLNTVKLLRECPDVLAMYQTRFEHILVDEYQDTNQAQNQIVLMLGAKHHNVCVVGDTDQSIYKFRGADFRNLTEFETAFPDATVVVLAQNYRSTQTILTAANAVITHNTGRHPKDLWTAHGGGDKIVRYFAQDEYDETGWVATTADHLHETAARPWREMAVFYRANSQSRVMEEALMRSGIPYKVVGGTKFYERREVRDALAYLRAAANPADEISLKRIINVPKRGIGDTSLAKVDAWARQQDIGFRQALVDCAQAGVGAAAVRGIASFLELMDALHAAIPNGPSEVLQMAMDNSGYIRELNEEDTVESAGRLENIAEFIGSAAEYTVVDEFLEQVSLVADTDDLNEENHIVLMTLHAAKGLEFPVVFLIGCEDGVFPHNRSLLDPQELEEERRLAYVGITRA